MYVCGHVTCSDPGAQSGFLGVYCHRDPVHRPHAHSWILPGLLPLLWQLRWEDVPGAVILHSPLQENTLLVCIRHHHHYLVSVCRLLLGGFDQRNDDVLSEISSEDSLNAHGSLHRSDQQYVGDINLIVFVSVCVLQSWECLHVQK